MMSEISTITRSPGETMILAEKLAGYMRPGDLIALSGDLGAGKTVFVKGLAKGLGVSEYNYVNSPSFVVVKEYAGTMPLYHFDVYRLDSKLFCETLDYEKYFYSEGVTAVEWAEKIRETLPEEYVDVFIGYGTGPEERVVKIVSVGPRGEHVLGEMEGESIV